MENYILSEVICQEISRWPGRKVRRWTDVQREQEAMALIGALIQPIEWQGDFQRKDIASSSGHNRQTSFDFSTRIVLDKPQSN